MTGEKSVRSRANDAERTDTAGYERAHADRRAAPKVERLMVDAVLVNESTGEIGVVASWAVTDADEDLVSVQLTVIDGERKKTSVTELVCGNEASGTTMVGLGRDVSTRKSGRVLVRVTARDSTGATASALRPAELFARRG
ncbi:hypothetical protein [Haloarchaeobius sp. DFWS5]|uniref:hypothetical protein n=1 Tax=Haloarchaeobius sp. DFWS5 TaxID=3446114 RepID=UPI003EC0F29A